MRWARICWFVCTLIGRAAADLPVHCLRHDLFGEWDFRLGGLSETRSSCGHERPDVQEVQPADLPEIAETRSIWLEEPDVARGADGTVGKFTMIYDEGFEVQLGGLTFFAFSRFELVGPKHNNVSHCGETARGWYRNADRTGWGCYHARKKEEPLSFMSIQQPKTHHSPEYDKPLDLNWHQEQVRKLNEKHSKWRARVYLQFVGLSLRQLNDIAGIRRTVPREAKQISRWQEQRAFLVQLRSSDCPDNPHHKPGEVLPHLLLRRPKPCQLRDAAIFTQPADRHTEAVEKSMPKAMDWRAWLPPVMDQADCGSCYMVSTIRMLSARHRIATNNSKAEPFSVSFPLHCSEYNQGCKGGYGFLASKWSEDVGLLPESCAPYDTKGRCHISCDLSQLGQRYHAANHRYVGGYYGASGAGTMMEEVFKLGPIVVSFEPTDEFMFYSGGIFMAANESPMVPLTAHQKEWQQVDHAVLLVGWGTEFGSKYWLVQNSWGPSWGEGGYFRILRGTNEAGIESIAVAADVVEDTRPQVLESFLAQGGQRVSGGHVIA